MVKISNLTELREFIRKENSSWSIAAKKLNSDKEFYHQENKKVGTASTIKLAIAAAIFEKIENNLLYPEQRIKMIEKDRIIGSGVLMK